MYVGLHCPHEAIPKTALMIVLGTKSQRGDRVWTLRNRNKGPCSLSMGSQPCTGSGRGCVSGVSKKRKQTEKQGGEWEADLGLPERCWCSSLHIVHPPSVPGDRSRPVQAPAWLLVWLDWTFAQACDSCCCRECVRNRHWFPQGSLPGHNHLCLEPSN